MADDQTPSPAAAAAARQFARLVDLMRRLRGPDGCPWDRKQTLASLAPFVLEEAYEVVDAIERDDLAELEGEVGDLIFEGVFLAQLCDEQRAFSAADAVQHVNTKLIRRHPHVFGTASPAPAPAEPVTTPEAVKVQWDHIKARERHEAGTATATPLHAVPRALPALPAAHALGKAAARVGFDWAAASDVLEKIDEELRELRQAMASEAPARTAEELGDLLFAVAQLARKLGVEPETALRAANRKFRDRFAAMAERLAAAGTPLEDASLEVMEAAWTAAKVAERNAKT